MPANTIDPWDSVWITLIHADLYPCLPSWQIAPARCQYDDLFYIVKGRGWAERDGQRLDAEPGDLFIFRTGHEMSAGHDPNKPVTVYSTGFLVRGPGNSDALRPYAFPDRLRLPFAERREIESLFVDLVSAAHDPGPAGRLAARGTLLRLLAKTIRLSGELPAANKSGAPPPLPGDETRAASVLEHINRNLEQPLSLEELARRAHLSPVYFATMFRKYTGQSPMAYVRQRRMEVARAHLASSDDSIERIARRVGFADPFHFSRVFRRVVGVAPSAYRSQFKNPFLQ